MRTRRKRQRRPVVDPGSAIVPVPSLPTVDPGKRGGVPLGRLLETARKRVSLSEAAAAHRLRVGEHEIFDFESGMRMPSNDLIDDMCEIYGTSRDRLLSDVGVALDDPENPTVVWIGWAPIDLTGTDNRHRLLRIGATYRELRNLAEDAPITVRDDELPTICRSIEVDHPDLVGDLTDAFRLGHERTLELFSRMQYCIATVKELPGPPAELGPG